MSASKHCELARKQGPDDTTFVAPLASTPIAVIEEPRSCSTNIAQPAGSFGTEEEYSSGNTITSRRSFDTSIPQNENIFVSLPC
jgi:hypothetical protein